jgi:hypothetical protein
LKNFLPRTGDLGQQLEFHNIYTRRGSNATIVCEPASRATKIYNIQEFFQYEKIVSKVFPFDTHIVYSLTNGRLFLSI